MTCNIMLTYSFLTFFPSTLRLSFIQTLGDAFKQILRTDGGRLVVLKAHY